ncbi:MAG TPA: hypothetical protein VFH10_09595 [Nocardioides sp.]|uniref:hypothetical protein n=1 Tax=Nocardioides sp. TaxID=35761 RepID=UPI002D809D80|nr:hypothetical protein [Nocardioides sp.]HET6652883.1 hypothetical protein [Nocardioides sp.]
MNTPGTTTPDAANRPAIAARCAVVTATLVLPRGSSRTRYRQEFLAELSFIERSASQLRFSVGILSRAWALRRALTEENTMIHDAVPRTPLLCRLHVHHQWHTETTEDGARYRRCLRCGKDHPSQGSGPGDWAAPVQMGGGG